MIKGSILKIQRYSIHDGPGIRTAVFLKGCPLNCWWCHNPEAQESDVRIIYQKNKCMICGKCVSLCHESAITVSNETHSIDSSRCSYCFRCISGCPTNALEAIGKVITVTDVIREIERDNIFYESSGGVTFTGGEPFYQFDFLYELLHICKQNGIHTVVETSGLTDWKNLLKSSSCVDMFYYDIKLMDENKHKKYTGYSNEIILDNLLNLSRIHDDICIRVPIIPGINDDDENIKKTCDFLLKTNIRKVEILPYHTIGVYKYDLISRKYKLDAIDAPRSEKLEKVKECFRHMGFYVS